MFLPLLLSDLAEVQTLEHLVRQTVQFRREAALRKEAAQLLIVRHIEHGMAVAAAGSQIVEAFHGQGGFVLTALHAHKPLKSRQFRLRHLRDFPGQGVQAPEHPGVLGTEEGSRNELRLAVVVDGDAQDRVLVCPCLLQGVPEFVWTGGKPEIGAGSVQPAVS